ncbi:FAD-dependent oxidoreductase [Nodularia spumigena]|uniref:FAD-dependent oxidoreductase n=1 Tax=Nodularia spumigena TaxID=70799 RepID=UPI002B1FFF26|nr:FAD-dependent oxidoreductase [Nodularia spumigena]MEA5557381.1 FAD-dependent oxidoreductase [Nodularia spumigena CH309]
MANKLPVKQKTKVTRIAQNENSTWQISLDNSETLKAKQLVLTLPLIQALDLCYRSGIIPSDKTVTFFNQQKYHPCISLLVASDADSMIPEPGGMWFDDQNAIRWAADNKKKGISKTTAITVHISPEMSNKWYDDSEEAIFSNLDSQLKELIPGNWVHKSIHKWRYSQPTNIVDLGYLNDEYYKNLWFTGDVFLNGRVESAWLAGLRTAQALKTKI